MKSILAQATFLLAALIANAQALDNTFNGNGIVITDYYMSVQSMCVQDDGRIIVGGAAYEDGIKLIRYQENGQLDQTFGSQGLVADAIGMDVERVYLALQGNKVIVGGWYIAPDHSSMMFAKRYNEDGTVDASFGSGGIALCAEVPFGDCGGPNASELRNYRGGQIVLHPDGKIQQAGTRSYRCGEDERAFFSVRYTANGLVDTSYHSEYPQGLYETFTGVEVTTLALAADSTVLIGGYGEGYSTMSDSDRVVPRIMPFPYSGELGGIGVGFYFKIQQEGVESFELQAMEYLGEKLVLAGTIVQDGKSKFAVAMLDTPMYSGFIDLKRDSAFGNDGLAIIDVGQGGGSLYSLAISDGKIILAGGANSNGFTGMDVVITRLNIDGSLDQGFGNSGKIYQDHSNGYDEAYCVKIYEDKLVVGGNTTQGLLNMNIFVMRYAEPLTSTDDLTEVVEIFPNPALNNLFIRTSKKINWLVFDSFGRKLAQGDNAGSPYTTIDISEYPKGIYYLEAFTDSSEKSRAVFLKH